MRSLQAGRPSETQTGAMNPICDVQSLDDDYDAADARFMQDQSYNLSGVGLAGMPFLIHDLSCAGSPS